MASLKNIGNSYYKKVASERVYIFSFLILLSNVSLHHCGNPRKLDNITYVIYLVNKVVGHN